MVRQHLRLNGHEFEQTARDNEGQGSLACCSPWVHKESDTIEQQQQGRKKFFITLLGSLTGSVNSERQVNRRKAYRFIEYVLHDMKAFIRK